MIHFSFSFLYHVAAVPMNSCDSDDNTFSSVRLARTLQYSILAKNTSMLSLFAPEKRICHFLSSGITPTSRNSQKYLAQYSLAS